MARVDVTCDSCSTRFEKPKVKPGDATMCPRCRSLVVVRAAPPPPPPRPPPEPPREPTPEVVFPHPEVVAEPTPEPHAPVEPHGAAAATVQRPHVELLRSCPWCLRRYDVELTACPRCGYSAARAQMMRNAALEEGTSVRRTPAKPASSSAAFWVAFGVLVVIFGGTRARGGGALVIALLVLGVIVWLANKVRPDGDDDRRFRP
jgi:DNA-directed RNA polymerase subunit RPC12/RpoP